MTLSISKICASFDDITLKQIETFLSVGKLEHAQALMEGMHDKSRGKAAIQDHIKSCGTATEWP